MSLKTQRKLIVPDDLGTNSLGKKNPFTAHHWHGAYDLLVFILHATRTGICDISSRSVILLIITDEAPSILTCLSLPEEGLSDRLQLCQLKADFLQVEGAPILDLPHGEWVHVHKGDVHQLPGEKEKTWLCQFGMVLHALWCADVLK